MKIAIIKKDFLGIGGGGAENYAQNICSELINRGHIIYVLSERFDAEERENLIHISVPKHKLFSTSGTTNFHKNVQKILLTAKKKYQFNIVYALSRTYPTDIFRVTEQVHIEWVKIGYSRLHKLNLRHRGILNLEKNICSIPNVKAIVTNSEMAKAQIISNYSFPKNAISVIRNGVDRTKYYTITNEFEIDLIRQRYLLKKDLASKFILLFVATNYRIKGLKYAIKTLALLDQKIRDNTLLFVVGNDNSEPYKKLAKFYGVENNILFLGQKDNLRDYYANSDLLFFPSLGEPFANICLEAFACGLPVLTTALNGSSEIVSHGINGFVVSSPTKTKQMASLITEYHNLQPAEKSKFSKSALNASLSYSWKNHVNNLEELFYKLQTKSTD